MSLSKSVGARAHPPKRVCEFMFQAILENNEQKKGGTKAELIDRVVDGKLFGALPRCPKCGGPPVRVVYETKVGHGGKGKFSCPGYYDGESVLRALWEISECRFYWAGRAPQVAYNCSAAYAWSPSRYEALCHLNSHFVTSTSCQSRSPRLKPFPKLRMSFSTPRRVHGMSFTYSIPLRSVFVKEGGHGCKPC